MRFGSVAILAFLAAVGAAVSNIEAQERTPPQTPWGDPDLQGIWTNEVTTTPMERPAEHAERELLTDEEVAARARRDAIRAQGASEEELDGVVRPWDLDRTTGYDKRIVGQEYNRFWTDPGPAKTERHMEANVAGHRSAGWTHPPLHSCAAATVGDERREQPSARPT